MGAEDGIGLEAPAVCLAEEDVAVEAGGDAAAPGLCFFRLGEGAGPFHAELGFGAEVVGWRAVAGVLVLALVHQVPEVGGVDQVQSGGEVGFGAAELFVFEEFEGFVLEVEQVRSVLDGFPQGVDVAMRSYELVRATSSTFFFRCFVRHFLSSPLVEGLMCKNVIETLTGGMYLSRRQRESR